MDVSSIVNIALPVVFILVGVALVWFIVELARTVKSAHKMVDDVNTKIAPTLEHVEKITNDLQPAVAKVDPLVERVSLTVDAANLELMRVDQILENVNEITDTVSSASNAIDTVASAPADLVSAVSDKVRGLMKGGRRASAESAELAAKKAEVRQTLQASDAEPAQEKTTASVVGDVMDRIADAAATQTVDDGTSAEAEGEKYYTYGANAEKKATEQAAADVKDAAAADDNVTESGSQAD